MLVGVPKEIKDNEFRVGMTPAAVAELVHHGHEVIVETSAGIGRSRNQRRGRHESQRFEPSDRTHDAPNLPQRVEGRLYQRDKPQAKASVPTRDFLR